MEKPVKILCVTGNPENQQSLSDLLQTESAFKTQVASSLSEALALAGQRAFDAVLLDLDLPDSQGLETLQSFQQAAPDVPLIVIGRHEAEGTAAVRAGAHDVVIPGDVSSSTLARILHDAILRQELRRTLEASKAGTQALLKANPDGILVVDQEGIVRQGNLTAERILGRPLEDLVGKPLGYPLDSTSPTEWTVLHPQAAPRIVEVRTVPIDWEGKPAYLATLRDITALRQAQEASAALESSLHAVTDAALDAIVTVDDNGTITSWNPAAERLFGYTSQEALGQNVHVLLASQQDRQAAAADFPMSTRAGELGPLVGRTVELTGWSKAGEAIPVELSLSAFQIQGRRHAVAIIRDIRERKRADAVLHRSHRLYRLLSAIDEAVLTAESPDALFQAVCQAAAAQEHICMAWIGLVDAARGVVTPVAAAGEGRDYVHSLHITTDARQPEGQGPTGRAVREGRIIASPAIEHDPAMAPWRMQAVPRGYRSSAAIPLRRGGQIVAVLNLYAAEPGVFDASEIKLLQRIEHDISRELEAMESEARRQQAMAAQAESERRFRDILEGVDLYAIMADSNGRVIFCNDAFLEATGWRREEVIGQDFFARFAPHDRERRWRYITLRYAGEVPAELRHRTEDIVTRDGQRRIVGWTNFLLRDTDGKPIALAALGRDITEMLQAQEALQAQSQRLSLLNQLTRSILSHDDLESMLTAMLEPLTASLRADLGAVFTLQDSQLNLTAYVGSDDTPCAALEALGPLSPQQSVLLSALQRETIHLEDLQTQSQDPFERALQQAGLRSMLALPLQTPDSVLGILVLGRADPGGFSEEEIATLHQVADQSALAIRHVQVYRELRDAYRDLKRAQQDAMMAERLRALGEMASGIAHDINNAISPAHIYASMLARDASLGDDVRQQLEFIRTSINDVAETVGRMREFYREREPTEALEPVDLNDVVNHVVGLTRPRWADQAQAQGATIEVRTELTEDLLPVHGRAHEIREALTNLVLNAVDAMPQGGTLTLRTRRSPAGEIVLEVQDTGVGMDEKTLARAPQPFFTTKGDQGTGLGLAMVFGIMKRHNGRLEITSAPGQGTLVRLVFPAPERDTNAQGTQTLEEPSAPLRILAIDDQDTVRQALQDMLESVGHEVHSAASGQAGLRAFEEAQAQGKPFDVVITDLAMPGMTGHEVLQAVKDQAPQTPVIVLSGWGAHHTRGGETTPSVQADAVLAKPPRVEALQAALARVVSTRRRERNGQAANDPTPPDGPQ